MNKQELLQMIESDLTLTPNNLEDKLYLIPSLHSKYLGIYFEFKTKLSKKERELSVLYKDKYIELKTKSDELLDKKEIQFYILGDEEYSKLNYEVKLLTDYVDILDRTLKKVNQLSFDAKNILAHIQFLSG